MLKIKIKRGCKKVPQKNEWKNFTHFSFKKRHNYWKLRRLWYNLYIKKTNHTNNNYKPKQLKLPLEIEKIIEISDPVYSFCEIIDCIDLLTKIHKEVLNNLNSIHGALLCMNRSIQAEGTFGIIKCDKSYERLRRKGLENVQLEFLLVACGYNLSICFLWCLKIYSLNRNYKIQLINLIKYCKKRFELKS